MALISTSEGIDAFLTAPGRRGVRKDKTVRWYNDTTFTPFLAQFKYLPTEPEPLEEFITAPESKHLHAVRFRNLKALYDFLERRRDFPNPVKKILPIAASEEEAIPLDDAEIGQILALDLPDQEIAMIHALLTTGLRPGELRNMKPEHIMEDTVVLDGKTGRDRAPLKPEVRELLLKVSGENYVFEDGEGRPYAQDALYRIIENILLRANVRDGKGGARIFRHTCGTRIYAATGDPFLVQRLLRHVSLSTTRRYEHMALNSTIQKYQEIDILPKREGAPPVDKIEAMKEVMDEVNCPNLAEVESEAEGPGVGAPEEHLFEDEPPPDELEGSVQLGFEIPPDNSEPTPPYMIREYTYAPAVYEAGKKLKCWRIIGSNGAWWPITGKPHNFPDFGQAQEKTRELWQEGK